MQPAYYGIPALYATKKWLQKIRYLFPASSFFLKHLDRICRNGATNAFKQEMGNQVASCREAPGFFDKITEELVDIDCLLAASFSSIRLLAHAYNIYRKVLIE